ncbi:MAG: hypothetical protein EBS41_04030 [Actinobacteria bacterium]|nr:hypothetical protein [Actinomycetota bacterium]
MLADYAGTGDGVLTALHLTAAVKRSGRSLADLASVFTRYPQVLINVRTAKRVDLKADAGVQRQGATLLP